MAVAAPEYDAGGDADGLRRPPQTWARDDGSTVNQRRFRILETLGRGGFGTVYRAEMTDAGGFTKQVALKVMHYQGEAAADIARRLRDEARVLGLIRHRAVVGVNSLVPLPDSWGVVMEYIDGVDLSIAIKHSLPSASTSLEIIEEVASALHAAWTTRAHDSNKELRLVHRDIKPSNVRVTRQGEVKLLDFGVAQASFNRKEAAEQVDYVMGSVRYMAPERRSGKDSHQSDVYALGLVMANLLTGKRFPEPPEGEADHSAFLGTVLENVRSALDATEAPELRERSGEIVRLLLEMLAYEAADRPDAQSVERTCRRLRHGLPAPGLRDWADVTIPRLQQKEREGRDRSNDGDNGKVLLEQASGVSAEPSTFGRSRTGTLDQPPLTKEQREAAKDRTQITQPSASVRRPVAPPPPPPPPSLKARIEALPSTVILAGIGGLLILIVLIAVLLT